MFVSFGVFNIKNEIMKQKHLCCFPELSVQQGKKRDEIRRLKKRHYRIES